MEAISPRMLRAISRTMLGLEMALAPRCGEAETRYLPFVSLGVEEFSRCMDVAIANLPGRRFMDVGCGIGTKLLFAATLGFNVRGIELRHDCAEVARRLVGQDCVTVANAFDVDSFDADVVYSHRCCVYSEEQLSLERHIAANMPTGSLLILPHGAMETPQGGGHLGANVWRIRADPAR